MKLHLNLTLRRALLATMSASSLFCTTQAGVMHEDATYQTYTDFGQNCGRYVVGSRENELLSYIRSQDKGIVIDYTDGSPSFVISEKQGMINFSGTHDGGHSAVISPTFLATVLHNASLNGSFSERTVGSYHALNYEAIDIRESHAFRLAPQFGTAQYDYMLQRQSKIVTDVTWNPLTSLTYEQIENLDGSYLYHSGGGTMYLWDEDAEVMERKTGPSSYIIGAINNINSAQVHADGENISIHQNPDYIPNDGADSKNPLPNGIRPGDSGSPVFIYNASTSQYEYIAAQQSAGLEAYGQARGNVEWTAETLHRFDVSVDMSAADTIYLNAVNKVGETISETVNAVTYSTTLYSGQATDSAGNVLAEYIGVKTGTNTWTDLSYLKDKENWYAFRRTVTQMGPDYGKVISDLNVADQDLFYTQNLVFTSSHAQNNIILNDTVDLGIGYAEFNKGKGTEKAVYTITSPNSTGNMFNHAGYVINSGAEVHLRLTNPDSHMTEWRKIGAGDLYIDGTGNTNALLNLGGSGTTYLQQTNGYAAYNVLVNSGAKVVISNTEQIERDLTFGAGGGTLDLNGSGTFDDTVFANCIDWYSSGGETRSGFTINALTEEAIITNTKGMVQLTYKEGGNKTFVGSFTDVAGSSGSSLRVVYDGGGVWTLNSIHTDISHNSSAFAVNSGRVILCGTNTVHGLGSASATNSNRLVNVDDWHYADASMPVEISGGATFELGSHARLRGNIVVGANGTFVLREGVKHRYEYVEGGSASEDTYQYSAFYGLHDSHIQLSQNAGMLVQYSAGTTSDTTLGKDVTISGSGSLTVDLGTDGGTLTLSGDNSGHRGMKTLVSGGLIATTKAALGNTADNKWKIEEKGWIASSEDSAHELLTKIDSSSVGVLALSENTETQLNLSEHQGLYIGAAKDKTVDYGTADQSLAGVNGQWKLGGGEGTLNVHFLLTGENDLIIGNEWTSGTVHLMNTKNDFVGEIRILGTGNLLSFEKDADTGESALGNARVALSYGNSIALHNSHELSIISQNQNDGVIAAANSMDLNLSGYRVSLGAVGELTFSGTITPGDIYRFGGSGSLILDTELDGAVSMEIDGQGTEGSSVTFARENAYSGDIVAGSGLHLQDANSTGSIGIHAGHADAFSAVNSMELRKGATLYTDAHANMAVQNLTALTGSVISNNGSTATSLEICVTDSKTGSIADGVLNDAHGSAAISLVKTGQGVLSLEANQSWSGGLTIREGQVNIRADKGGVGSAASSIHIEQGGTLRVDSAAIDNYGKLGSTILGQKLSGEGTIVVASGGSMLLSQQTDSFEGKVHVTGNTRLYVGTGMMNNISTQASYNNKDAFDEATIQVDSGSQVRITSNMVYVSDVAVTSAADYIIAGDGMLGKTSTGLFQDTLTRGALSIDCGAIITGSVTLADHATIASWSNSVVDSRKMPGSTVSAPYCWYRGTTGTSIVDNHYGIKNYLGGTIRGQILGEGKQLTIAGTEGMTFTADAANTYGNLTIANQNGNNDEKFALRLDGGKAVSQTSTALGTGSVSLGDDLILRLAGTGVQNNTDVVYTYANNITAGNNATLQSYNITNRLTGTVSMSGDTLHLATANGGVLELTGGISGSGTLNVGKASQVILGTASAGTSFSGSVVAGVGADISLLSAGAVSAGTNFSGTESMTLRLGGTDDYALGGISGVSALTLHFDFTNTPMSGDADTWATLSSSISATTTTIALDLNLFNDLEKGNYTLISSAGSGTTYQLADNMNGRLNLVTNDDGALVLTVDADSRLFWRTGGSGSWNSTDANWYSDAAAGMTAFSSNANVMLDRSGVAEGNSPAARETISLSDSVTAGTLGVQESAYEVTGAGAISGTSLVVGNGGDMKLSNAGGSTFTEGVVVNDAALTVAGNALTANVEVENNATLALTDSAAMAGDLSVSDAEAVIQESSVQGNISLSGAAQVQMESAQISGSVVSDGGTLELNSARLSGNLSNGENTLNSTALTILSGLVTSAARLKMDSLCLLDGSLQINAAANIGTLGISAGKTVTLWNQTEDGAAGADKIIGTAELANGAVLQSNDRSAVTAATKIGTVKLTGVSATLTDVYHSGFFEIHNLEGAADSVLNLVKNVPSNNVGVYALGDADGTTENGSQYAGTILVKQQNASTDGSRDVVLLLNHESVAQKATINLASAAQATPKVALGINVESATIGGLRSGSALASRAIVFSGAQYSNRAWVDRSAEPAHTLIIDTTGGSSYEFYGQVQNVNLVIAGEGTQKFLGTGDNFTGSLSIQGGTAVFNTSSFSMLNNAASVSVGSGTLDVSAIDFADASNKIRVSSGQSISFADTAMVAFGNMEADREYGIFDISGGELEGWFNLTASNFTVGGVKLSDLGRVELALGMTGSFSYTIADGWDLVWNGGEEKQIWNQSEANQVWQTASTDPTTGAPTDSGYKNNDNVIFNSNADLELEGNIRVNNLTVSDEVKLKTAGSLTVTGSLSVGNNVSWSFSGDTNLSFTEAQLKSVAALEVGEGATLTMTDKETNENTTSTAFDNVSGSGNVVLNLSTTDNGVGFNLSRISGDITVATGRLQVNTSTFNEESDIYLSSSKSQLVFNGSGTVLKNDVILGVSTTFHINNQCSGTTSGVISGNGGLTKAGAGALTFKQQNTYTGATTINDGTIILDTKGEYRLQNSISGGTLEVAGGTTLVNDGNTISSALVLQDKSAVSLTGNNTLTSGTVKVADNATATLMAESATIKDNMLVVNTGSTLKLQGGVYTFENGNALANGSGVGTIDFSASSMSLNGAVTTTFAGRFNILSDVTFHMNRGSGGDWATTGANIAGTMSIGEGKTMTVTGNSRFQINDGGTLLLQDDAKVNRTDNGAFYIKGSLTTAAGADAEFKSVDDVHHNYINTGKNLADTKASVDVAENSTLTVDVNNFTTYGEAEINVGQGGRLDMSGTNALNLSSDTSVNLAKKASLAVAGMEFSNRGAADNATLEFTASSTQKYTADNTNYTLTDGHAKYTAASVATLANKLVNSSVENAGSGKLTVNNAANSITDVYASAGDMAIMQQAAGLNLDELVVADGKTVSAYTGTSETASAEANVTVRGRAEFGKGAVLNANLTLASGSSLSVAEGGLAMGSTLTLNTGITLDEDTLRRVYSLNRGESVALFTGVDGLTLGETSYTGISTDDEILASPYFSNLNSDQYRLTYTGTDNGTLAIISAAVPEPTSSMLGLMGLVAFTLRRRRRK